MSIKVKAFSIDLDIEEKERDFDRNFEKIEEWMVKEKAAFQLKMKEYKRMYIEKEETYAQQMKELLGVHCHLNEAYKSNSNNIQGTKMMAMAKEQMKELENSKETQRAIIHYNEFPFSNNFPSFEVKYVTQPDYTKKIKPIKKMIQESDKSYRLVYGCDSGHNGYVYMADYNNNQVYVVNKQNGQTVKPIGAGTISKPWGVKVNKGFVYVTEPENGRLCVFNKKGEFHYSKRFDSRGFNPKLCTSRPTGIDVDREGRVYVVDTGQKKIHILDSKSFFSVDEIQCKSLVCPLDVKVVGGKIYVLDNDELLVKVFDKDGRLLNSLIPNIDKRSPEFFAVDTFGNILICNQKLHCVQIYDSQGNLIHQIACGLSYLGGIAVKKNGEITLVSLGEELISIF